MTRFYRTRRSLVWSKRGASVTLARRRFFTAHVAEKSDLNDSRYARTLRGDVQGTTALVYRRIRQEPWFRPRLFFAVFRRAAACGPPGSSAPECSALRIRRSMEANPARICPGCRGRQPLRVLFLIGAKTGGASPSPTDSVSARRKIGGRMIPL